MYEKCCVAPRVEYILNRILEMHHIVTTFQATSEVTYMHYLLCLAEKPCWWKLILPSTFSRKPRFSEVTCFKVTQQEKQQN